MGKASKRPPVNLISELVRSGTEEDDTVTFCLAALSEPASMCATARRQPQFVFGPSCAKPPLYSFYRHRA